MRVREILCKSAIVKSKIPGVDFALNPYTGCEHGCVYCYASFMTRFSLHPETWGGFVDVKVNFPQALRRECRRVGGGEIVISSVTDPYQPVEAEYGITRECLHILEETQDARSEAVALPGSGVAETSRVPLVSVLTKSDMVVRDADILSRMRRVEVGMTVTTVDDRVSRAFEPRAPDSSRRFRALEILATRGIYTWAFAGPLIPHYSDGAESIRVLFSRLRDAGVRRILVDRMNMYPACVSGVLRALQGESRAARRLAWARDDPAGYEAELRAGIEEARAGAGCPIEVVF